MDILQILTNEIFIDRPLHADMRALTIGSTEQDDVQFVSGRGEEFTLRLRFDSGGWQILDNKGNVTSLPYGGFVPAGNGGKFLIRVTRNEQIESIFPLKGRKKVLIGKNSNCDLCIREAAISRQHAFLLNDRGNWHIIDHKSTYGVYVNGRRVDKAALLDGDIISIAGSVLRFAGDNLYLRDGGIASPAPRRNPPPYPWYRRTPRIVSAPVGGRLELSLPPQAPSRPQISWLSVLLPPLMMMAFTISMAVLVFKSAYTLFTVGMTAMSMITGIINYFMQKNKHKKTMLKREELYLEYMRKQEKILRETADRQRRLLSKSNPSLDELFTVAKQRSRQLWEKTPQDRDFLHLRLGLGDLPLQMEIVLPRKNELSLEDDPLIQVPFQCAEKYSVVDGIPILLPLGVLNAVGLLGERQKTLGVLRALIVQLAALHAPGEVKLAVFFSFKEREQWEWMRNLPHVWNDARDMRFMADDPERGAALSQYLLDELQKRLRNAREQTGQTGNGAHYLLIIGDETLLRRDMLADALQNDMGKVGFHALFLADSIKKLDEKSQAIINIDRTSFLYIREGAQKIKFRPEVLDVQASDSFARFLAPVRMAGASGGQGFPGKLTYLDLLGISAIDEIGLTRRYALSAPYQGLAIPIGVRAGGERVSIDLHDRFDGPHGLVAGTTGSGKSEFLQTLILSLALHFHPHEVGFVLIDYKGGSMAAKFAGIPHLLGVITNIDGKAVDRALVSIKSELARRQQLFKDNGNIQHIDTYQQRVREGMIREPLPRLIIIADEFAELKQNQPEFMKELVSTARVGRSLGVHLILATQRPDGIIDDQIESNTRFRACFRVNRQQESKSVIHHPDASDITVAGRGFYQVGNDEIFMQFQSAWSGAPYVPNERDSAHEIIARPVLLDGKRLIAEEEKANLSGVPSELDQIVQYICTQTQLAGIMPLRSLWLPPLPGAITLKELRDRWPARYDSGAAFTVPIGLVDAPARQEQFPCVVDFTRDGHMCVLGAPGTGKTTLLQTLLMSLVTARTPEECNLYIIDFGGRTMSAFGELPHTGCVVLGDEDEKYEKLSKLLLTELDERIKEFSKAGATSLGTYHAMTGEVRPAIFVVVDNITSAKEAFADIIELLAVLSRDGGGRGIYLILSGDGAHAIPTKILQNIKTKLCLRMNDRADYAMAVGNPGGVYPENLPGRGLMNMGEVFEFHTALPIEGENEAERMMTMRALFRKMSSAWDGRKAKAVRMIPEDFRYDDLIRFEEAERDGACLPIGLDSETVIPSVWCPDENPALLLASARREGKTEFLHCLIKSIKRIQPEAPIIAYGFTPEHADTLSVYDDIETAIKRVLDVLTEREMHVDMAANPKQARELLVPLYFLADRWEVFAEESSEESGMAFLRAMKAMSASKLRIAAAVDESWLASHRDFEMMTKELCRTDYALYLNSSGFNVFSGVFPNINLPFDFKQKRLRQGEALVLDRGGFRRVRLPKR